MNEEELKFNLESQIREAFGRVMYSYTTHLKQVDLLRKNQSSIKWVKIILSAISTSGILSIVLVDSYFLKVTTALFSIALTAVTLYFREFNITEEIASHTATANSLWQIREEYISLLTDFPTDTIAKIQGERDTLMHRTKQIYDAALKTSPKSYHLAQKALKDEEEQFFTDYEIDQFLPQHLRRTGSGSHRSL